MLYFTLDNGSPVNSALVRPVGAALTTSKQACTAFNRTVSRSRASPQARLHDCVSCWDATDRMRHRWKASFFVAKLELFAAARYQTFLKRFCAVMLAKLADGSAVQVAWAVCGVALASKYQRAARELP